MASRVDVQLRDIMRWDDDISWNSNDTPFDRKRPCFGGLTFFHKCECDFCDFFHKNQSEIRVGSNPIFWNNDIGPSNVLKDRKTEQCPSILCIRSCFFWSAHVGYYIDSKGNEQLDFFRSPTMIVFSMECFVTPEKMRKSEAIEATPHTGQSFVGDGPASTGYSTIVRLLNDYIGSELWLWNCVFPECFWSCSIRVEQHVFIQGIMFVGFYTFFWTYSSKKQCRIPSRWWTCWYFQHSGWSYLRDFRLWQSSDTHHASACGRHVPALRLPSDDERLPKRRSVRLLPLAPSRTLMERRVRKRTRDKIKRKLLEILNPPVDLETSRPFLDDFFFWASRTPVLLFSRALLILLAGTTP